jgi:hypothetical protein
MFTIQPETMFSVRYALRRNKQFRIGYVLCEVRYKADERVEHRPCDITYILPSIKLTFLG